jgi:hypothetical protein
MSRALPSFNRRRVLVAGVVGGALVSGVVVVGAAMAGQARPTAAAAPTVSCPAVRGALPAIPSQARAEVDRNLALLDTQIAEADRRLVTSRGEGGPAFVDNAILGPLKDKRVATLDRIAIAIGRHAARPTGLEALAGCALSTGGATAAPAAPAPAASATPSGGSPAAAGDSIVCPDVASRVGAVPAAARAEVDRELALLQRQIQEADTRLVTTRGQGGPNFVDNAILGPLRSKRAAVIDRITIAISRQGATAPTGLAALAGCALR